MSKDDILVYSKIEEEHATLEDSFGDLEGCEAIWKA